MRALDQHQAVYEDLADHYDRKGEARQRDIFLVLAADAAHHTGRSDQAERLRLRLMQLSPHNLLRPYPTFADALRSQDIQDYVADLRRQYPPDQALTLMRTLGGPNYEPKAIPAPPVYRFQPESTAKPGRPSLPPKTTVTTPNAPATSPYDTFAPYAPPAGHDADSGAWLATVLFVVGILGALVIAVWTLGRPFFN